VNFNLSSSTLNEPRSTSTALAPPRPTTNAPPHTLTCGFRARQADHKTLSAQNGGTARPKGRGGGGRKLGQCHCYHTTGKTAATQHQFGVFSCPDTTAICVQQETTFFWNYTVHNFSTWPYVHAVMEILKYIEVENSQSIFSELLVGEFGHVYDLITGTAIMTHTNTVCCGVVHCLAHLQIHLPPCPSCLMSRSVLRIPF